MKLLTTFLKVYIIFISSTAYLFGQLFWGEFSFDATLIGISAICTMYFWNPLTKVNAKATAFCALLTIAGFIWEALDYSLQSHAQGNDFAWDIRIPFYAIMLLVLINSLYKLNKATTDT